MKSCMCTRAPRLSSNICGGEPSSEPQELRGLKSHRPKSNPLPASPALCPQSKRQCRRAATRQEFGETLGLKPGYTRGRAHLAQLQALKSRRRNSTATSFFPLSSPEGGAGRGEEAQCFLCSKLKSPHPGLLPAWAGRRSYSVRVRVSSCGQSPRRSRFAFARVPVNS